MKVVRNIGNSNAIETKNDSKGNKKTRKQETIERREENKKRRRKKN